MKNEIKIYARGGLGNQLFQYGAAHHLSHELNLPIIVDDLLVSDFARFNAGLNKSFLEIDSFESEMSFIHQNSKFKSEIQSRVLGVSRLVGDHYPDLMLKLNTYANEHLDQIATFRKIAGPVSLNAYCSTPSYFPDCGHQIATNITKIKNPSAWYTEWSKKIQDEKPIGLNVRLGDYKNLAKIYGKVDIRYYQRSAEIIQKLIGPKPIFIFSDEPELARDILKPAFGEVSKVPLSNTPRPIEYLNVLAKCSGIVCANSSFSWWASFVASELDPDVKVVFPRPMFNDSSIPELFDWLPQSWMTVGRNLNL